MNSLNVHRKKWNNFLTEHWGLIDVLMVIFLGGFSPQEAQIPLGVLFVSGLRWLRHILKKTLFVFTRDELLNVQNEE